MLAIERRNNILEQLQNKKRVVVSELSMEFGVSEETIRRDLEKLENDGLVIKSYGGAVLNEHSIFDLPYNVRKNQQITEKQQIANLIADTIRDGEAIMLDASSTSVYIAKKLKENKKKLTVITNSVEVLVELYDMSEWNVISTGGVSRQKSFALVGPHADELISSYHVEKAIISCKGLDIEAGFTDADEQNTSCKRMMLKAAKEKILAADSSKFGEIAFKKIADWNEITKVVTNKKPDKIWLDTFEQLRIECVYPEKV